MISKERINFIKSVLAQRGHITTPGFIESVLEISEPYRLSHPAEESEGEPALPKGMKFLKQDGYWMDYEWWPDSEVALNMKELERYEAACRHMRWREKQQKHKVGTVVTDEMAQAALDGMRPYYCNLEGMKLAIAAALAARGEK